MPYDWKDSPWTRAWACTQCNYVYRYDLSAEDGGPNLVFSGHCAGCTRGIWAGMVALNMVEGNVRSCPSQLNWTHAGEGITCVPSKSPYRGMDVNPVACGIAEAKPDRKTVKKIRKQKTEAKKTAKKAAVDDFLNLAGL